MGIYTGTIPSLSSLHAPTAAELLEITNALTALTAAWTSYTPAWTSSGTAPVLGNGTISGKYRRLGKTVEARVTLTMGSTTTFGTGAYLLSLPVAAVSVAPRAIGAAWFLDFGTAAKEGTAPVDGTLSVVALSASGAQVTSTSPHTWAVNDEISFSITYDVA